MFIVAKQTIYSDNQKTVEYKDDIKAILECIWWCYKANSFTIIKSLKWNGSVYVAQLLCLMFIGLFKVITWVKSRLPISIFSFKEKFNVSQKESYWWNILTFKHVDKLQKCFSTSANISQAPCFIFSFLRAYWGFHFFRIYIKRIL